MRVVAQVAVALIGLWVVTGTALNLSRRPHWYIRGWDFPRPVILGIAAAVAGAYGVFFFEGAWYDVGLLAGLGLAAGWQLVNIFPYTRLAPRPVQPARSRDSTARLRLVVTNVLVENRQFDQWLEVIGAAQADVVLAVEVNREWDRQLERLAATHPHSVRYPLENAYGMALFSRFPLRDHRVEFIVQADIPSIHAVLELGGGQLVWLHCIHPRPPEPLRRQDARPRDAELMKVARRVREAPPRPTVVAGDLNDVAWSYTTHLFLRESGLLDPRLGRGFFNTFNAKNPLFRFPLDHVFHSNHFRLGELRRLDRVGSDHFPVLAELSLEPEGQREQPAPRPDADDRRQVAERIEGGRNAAPPHDG